ncbi:MAG: hypothetical protein ACYC2U_08430 [Candidatus Amoebophilus sp.]
MDGVDPTYNVNLSYGWIKEGVRKEVAANSGRYRLNLSGALDILSHQVLIREDTTIDFLHNLKNLCIKTHSI